MAHAHGPAPLPVELPPAGLPISAAAFSLRLRFVSASRASRASRFRVSRASFSARAASSSAATRAASASAIACAAARGTRHAGQACACAKRSADLQALGFLARRLGLDQRDLLLQPERPRQRGEQLLVQPLPAAAVLRSTPRGSGG